MFTKESQEEAIEHLFQRWPFQKMAEFYKANNWEWSSIDGMKIPDQYDLMGVASDLITRAFKSADETGLPVRMGRGGLEVRIQKFPSSERPSVSLALVRSEYSTGLDLKE